MTTRRDSAVASNAAPAPGRLRGVAGLLALFLAAASSGTAAAADLFDTSFLRGSLGGSPVRWDGVVLGGQLGYSSMSTNFGNSTSGLIAYSLRNTEVESQFSPSSWTTLPSKTTNGRQYGAFIGYNWQFNELVLGVDAAYNRVSSLTTSASDSIARQVVTTPDDVNNSLTITAQSSVKLIDYATARARAGYAIGQFLPYAMIGLAVGRFDYANTATVHNVGTPPVGSPILPFNVTDVQSDAKNNAFDAGFLFGLGMDVAITPNIFLRGEWEYIAFNKIGGTLNALNTGRVGLGVRF